MLISEKSRIIVTCFETCYRHILDRLLYHVYNNNNESGIVQIDSYFFFFYKFFLYQKTDIFILTF